MTWGNIRNSVYDAVENKNIISQFNIGVLMLIKLLMIVLIINFTKSSVALDFRSIILGKYLYVIWSDYSIFRYNMEALRKGNDSPLLYSNST